MMKSNKKYLTDVVGEEYKNWTPGNKIFITAHTGTGKSHFILYEYLKWVISKKQKILYFVNRRILKDQLNKELHSDVRYAMQNSLGTEIQGIDNYITLMTYQELEERIIYNDAKLFNKFEDFSAVVYDECHYFFNDSNFNTNTELSYDYLTFVFENRIQIFMSATIENVKEMILLRKPLCFVNPILNHIRSYPDSENLSYHLSRETDYINLHILDDPEELRDIILANFHRTGKWLIFTDNIESGKKLAKRLIQKNGKEKGIPEDDVVFIDADYLDDQKARNAVDQVIQKNAMSHRVVISTAVMDNGISFHDNELRNMVILADTKESFLQMLGRKREDGLKFELYICRQNRTYFTRRKQYIERIMDFYYHNESFWVNQKQTTLPNHPNPLMRLQIEPVERRFKVPHCQNYASLQGILSQLNRSAQACDSYSSGEE